MRGWICLIALLCSGLWLAEAQAFGLRDRIRARIGATDDSSSSLAETGHDPEQVAPGSRYVMLTQSGGDRRYLLHVPPNPGGAPMPLIVVLHGFGSNPAQQEALSGFSALSDRQHFIVAYPYGMGRQPQWRFMGHDDQDEQFIRAVVDDVARYAPLDRRRVYATGISNGAQMTARLACIAPDLFAAVAPVSGNYMGYTDCNTMLPMPAVLFHGTNDRLLPYSGRFVQFSPQHWAETLAKQNGCDAKPIITFRQAEVTAQSWRSCRKQAEVVFYTLAGKGHSWPGSAMPEKITSKTINASAIIWALFQRYSR